MFPSDLIASQTKFNNCIEKQKNLPPNKLNHDIQDTIQMVRNTNKQGNTTNNGENKKFIETYPELIEMLEFRNKYVKNSYYNPFHMFTKLRCEIYKKDPNQNSIHEN